MQCTEAEERMWLRLAQENVEDMQLNQHLTTCSECARLWREMQQFEQQLGALKLEQPSAGFVDRVMEHIEREPLRRNHIRKKNAWTTWNHLWVASAATFVLLQLGGGAMTDSSTGLPSVTVYALKFGWTVTEIAGKIPNLF